MNFEQIVRPFQRLPTQTTQRIIASRTKIDVPDAIAQWGQAGTLPGAIEITPTEDGFAFKVVDCDERFQENSRETEDIRIENPDDPNQYVVDQRIKKITFNKQEPAQTTFSYNKTSTAYAPSPAASGSPATFPAPLNTGQINVYTDENKLCKNEYKLNN